MWSWARITAKANLCENCLWWGGTLKPDGAAPTPSLLCLLSCVTLDRKAASLGSGSLAANKGPPRWVVTGSEREIKCRGSALCCRAPEVCGGRHTEEGGTLDTKAGRVSFGGVCTELPAAHPDRGLQVPWGAGVTEKRGSHCKARQLTPDERAGAGVRLTEALMRRAGGSRTPSRGPSPQRQARSERMVCPTLPPPTCSCQLLSGSPSCYPSSDGDVEAQRASK